MTENQKTRIWDLPIRLFHWTLALLIAASWGTAHYHLMPWHKLSGYAVLTLLLFRLIWGAIGSQTARFSHFVRGPRAIWTYARHFLAATPSHALGHNPMGALSVIALLAVLCLQVGTGLVLSDTDFINSGPLSAWVSYDTSYSAGKLHRLNFTIIEILIALHVGVIVFYALRKRENLVTPMLTGVKNLPVAGEPLRFTPAWIAALALLACAAFVWWLVTQAR